MKKLLGIVMAGLLAVSAATAASAADGISVVINDKPVEFGDVAPQIIESRTMVPLRAIFEALNATVDWDDATKTVKSTKGDTTISLTIGENKLIKNGEDKELDVPAQIIESRTLVPVRAISEAFDCKVDWEDSTKTVKITYEEKTNTVDKVDGAIITLANAEPETADVAVYADGAEMKVVEDARDAANHVYDLKANVTDKASWTYLWFNTNDYKPGQKYKVEYDVCVTGNVAGADMADKIVTVGTCFKYSTSDGENNKDHGMGGITFEGPDGKKWAHVSLVGEIPSTYVEGSDTRFGIYVNPIKVDGYDHNVAVSFQIDNLSVLPFNREEKNIDYSKITGVVYDFKADEDLGWKPAGSTISFDGDDMVLTANEGSTDPQITLSDLSLKADDYNAFVVRFKPDTTVGAKQANAYFATDTETAFSEDRGIYLNFSDMYTDDEGYKWAVFKFGDNPSWIGTVTGIRFDPVSAAGGVHRIDKIIVTKI